MKNLTCNYGLSELVLKEICTKARECGVEKMKLFGSRARGDFHKTSDIDLAVWGGNTSLFFLEIDENTQTLLKYDVVNMDGSVQEELRKRIEQEGKLIYEKAG